jgi:hypothetical protein
VLLVTVLQFLVNRFPVIFRGLQERPEYLLRPVAVNLTHHLEWNGNQLFPYAPCRGNKASIIIVQEQGHNPLASPIFGMNSDFPQGPEALNVGWKRGKIDNRHGFAVNKSGQPHSQISDYRVFQSEILCCRISLKVPGVENGVNHRMPIRPDESP